MAQCPFCQKNASGSGHIYKCKKQPIGISRKEIKFQYIGQKVDFHLTKEWVYQKYCLENYSIPDLAKFGFSYNDIYFLLDYFGLKKRTASESAKKIVVKKTKKYYLENYGVENVSQIEGIKEKKRKRKPFLKIMGMRIFLRIQGLENILIKL